MVYPVQIYRPNKHGELIFIKEISSATLERRIWKKAREDADTYSVRYVMYGRQQAKPVKKKQKPVNFKMSAEMKQYLFIEKVIDDLHIQRHKIR